jgi:branched-subunit amino acid transport protein
VNSDDLQAMLAIGGLALITVLTRAFFMIPRREIPMPGWLRRGLKYAPLAALTAVIAPEVFMTQGLVGAAFGLLVRLPTMRSSRRWNG